MPMYVEYDPNNANRVTRWYNPAMDKLPLNDPYLIEATVSQVQAIMNVPGYTVVDGVLTAPTPTIMLSLAQFDQTRIVKESYQNALKVGYSSSALGSSYNYNCTSDDVLNVLNSIPNGGSLYCGQNGTWAFTAHTAVQAAQVQKDMWTFMQGVQTTYYGYISQINSATNIAAVQAITWQS